MNARKIILSIIAIYGLCFFWANIAFATVATYTINVSVASGQSADGTVSPSGSTVVNAGSSLTITLTPSNGYTAYLETDEYTALTLTNNTYTFTNINANHTLIASFAQTYTTPPTVPANLTATAFSSSQVNLSWTPSTDAGPVNPLASVGQGESVSGYVIYRNGVRVGVNDIPQFTDFFLSPNTTYTYTVQAYDFEWNYSAQSSAAIVTTPAAVYYPPGSPELDFSDIVTGPNSGNTDTSLGQTSGVDGAIVTIWGKNLGTTQGSSQVLFNGTAARVYSWGNAISPANLYARQHMQMIVFQIPGSAPVTGSGITVVVNGQTSNPLAFTVSTGNIYYISTAGNDNNPGTFQSPWQTLIKARNSAVPGDIFYAENGVSQTIPDPDNLSWHCALLMTHGGTYQQPIALIAYPGATVTIGSSSIYAGIRNAGAYGYWVFSKLNLTGGYGGVDNALFEGDRVIGSYVWNPTANQYIAGISGDGNNLFILGNEVTNTGMPGANKQCHPIYISGNRTFNGPRQPEEANREIGWNYLHDNYAPRGINIYSEEAFSAFISASKVHDNFIINQEGGGMLIGSMMTGNNWYYNNVVANAGLGPEPVGDNLESHIGVEIQPSGVVGYPQTDLYFYNNTVYGSGFSQAAAGSEQGNISIMGTNTFNLHFYNNLIYSTGNPYLATQSDSSPLGEFGNNIWFGKGAGPSWDPSSYSIDPGFENSSNFDFHLTQNNVAAENGNSLVNNVVTKDFDSIPLPESSNYNIGAYMYAASSLPVVTITSPANGATFTAGSNAIITTTASEVNGTISNISLYNSSGTLLGSSSTSPYYFNLTNMPVGSTTYYAVATDVNGVSMTSGIVTLNVTATSPTVPAVAITSPANGNSYSPGSNVTITATASETSGTISSLAIYNQYGILLGASDDLAISPVTYSYTYNNMPAGTYIFYAVATDNQNNGTTEVPSNTTTSSPVTITVTSSPLPVVAITSPANGSTFTAGSNVPIITTASESGGTIASIKLYNDLGTLLGTGSSSPYTFTDTGLTAGTYTFYAVATDTNGFSTSSGEITITVAPVTYTLDVTAVNGTVAQTVSGVSSSPPYNAGTVVTLTATPATGYQFSSWNGAVTGSTNPATVTMSADESVTANFSLETETISISASENGSISPSGNVHVNYGSDKTITVIPRVGYTAQITVDGLAESLTGSLYTIQNVIASHTVSVNFTPKVQVIRIGSGGSGGGSFGAESDTNEKYKTSSIVSAGSGSMNHTIVDNVINLDQEENLTDDQD